MSKLTSIALGLLLGGGLLATAHAADSSATATIREAIRPVGNSPQKALLKGTVTGTPTAILDLPADVPTYKIRDVDCRATDSEGVDKPLKLGVFGRTVSATSSGAASGTLVVGDIIRCDLTLKP